MCGNDKYIDIALNVDGSYFVNVRWQVDGEQHEVNTVDTIDEVLGIVESFLITETKRVANLKKAE